MRGHDSRQVVLDEQAIRPHVRFQIDELAPVHRQRDVRVGDHRPMTGKVLGDRRHAGLAHTHHVGGRQSPYAVRVPMERAVADDLAHPVVQIDAGREAEVHAHGPQLACHEPTDGAGQRQGLAAVLVEPTPQGSRGGQSGEMVPEALHSAALMVDRHQQLRRAHGAELGGQRGNLRGVAVIAGEEEHAAHQRVGQNLAVLRAQFRPGDVDHERAQRSWAHAFFSNTAIDSTCVVCGNISITPAPTNR